MDNYEKPSEMTVNLDVRGQKFGHLPPGPTARQGSDRPVFVDETGRRGKQVRRLGCFLSIVCICFAAAIVATLIGGNSSAPWMPGIVQQSDEQSDESDQSEVQPTPGDSAVVTEPSGTPGDPDPADSTGTTEEQPSNGDTDGVSDTPGPGASDADSDTESPQSAGHGRPKPRTTPASFPGTGDPSPGKTTPAPSPSDPTVPGTPTAPPAQEGTL
jgi:hypothetical protein